MLGLHSLSGPGGRELTSLPAQPKWIAVLAYLALGDGGHHRRERVAAVFWHAEYRCGSSDLPTEVRHCRARIAAGVACSAVVLKMSN
jgi:hypothetical protein